ncbi:MAG: hypothetical protein HY889_02745 [Deltaproteobacteria bacterium]|nr:hypothetical protein [Deltaproteobacteria bacterium]
MKAKVSAILVLLTFFVLANGAAYAESELVKKFRRALNSKDFATMTILVQKNRNNIPSEVNALVDEAFSPGAAADTRESMFTVAEFLADEYKNQTGDISLLKSVKVRIFESKLSKPVNPALQDGVYTVESVSSDKVKNIFIPDNIIIKKGSTVRWVNNDNVAHLLASVPVIGGGGIFSPTIDPGSTWQYTFNKAGEYYYICFIHKVMYGKVTVVE